MHTDLQMVCVAYSARAAQAPQKPCKDCYNDTAAAADIAMALANGFRGVDTGTYDRPSFCTAPSCSYATSGRLSQLRLCLFGSALGYGNQRGVGLAVRSRPGE
jgi:hypothetical protein